MNNESTAAGESDEKITAKWKASSLGKRQKRTLAGPVIEHHAMLNRIVMNVCGEQFLTLVLSSPDGMSGMIDFDQAERLQDRLNEVEEKSRSGNVGDDPVTFGELLVTMIASTEAKAREIYGGSLGERKMSVMEWVQSLHEGPKTQNAITALMKAMKEDQDNGK